MGRWLVGGQPSLWPEQFFKNHRREKARIAAVFHEKNGSQRRFFDSAKRLPTRWQLCKFLKIVRLHINSFQNSVFLRHSLNVENPCGLKRSGCWRRGICFKERRQNVAQSETCHFWVGFFPDGESVGEYFIENYDRKNDEEPFSPFARDQNESWYDHDFLEYGFLQNASSVEELVNGYSYSDQNSEELAKRAADAGLSGINTFIFITDTEIEKPCSVEGKDYWLRYLGTITYQI